MLNQLNQVISPAPGAVLQALARRLQSFRSSPPQNSVSFKRIPAEISLCARRMVFRVTGAQLAAAGLPTRTDAKPATFRGRRGAAHPDYREPGGTLGQTTPSSLWNGYRHAVLRNTRLLAGARLPMGRRIALEGTPGNGASGHQVFCLACSSSNGPSTLPRSERGRQRQFLRRDRQLRACRPGADRRPRGFEFEHSDHARRDPPGRDGRAGPPRIRGFEWNATRRNGFYGRGKRN